MSALTFKTFIGTTQDLNKALFLHCCWIILHATIIWRLHRRILNGTRLLPKSFLAVLRKYWTRDRCSQVIIIRYNVPIVFGLSPGSTSPLQFEHFWHASLGISLQWNPTSAIMSLFYDHEWSDNYMVGISYKSNAPSYRMFYKLFFHEKIKLVGFLRKILLQYQHLRNNNACCYYCSPRRLLGLRFRGFH